MVKCSEEYGRVCPLLNFGIIYKFRGTLAGLKADPFFIHLLRFGNKNCFAFPLPRSTFALSVFGCQGYLLGDDVYH